MWGRINRWVAWRWFGVASVQNTISGRLALWPAKMASGRRFSKGLHRPVRFWRRSTSSTIWRNLARAALEIVTKPRHNLYILLFVWWMCLFELTSMGYMFVWNDFHCLSCVCVCARVFYIVQAGYYDTSLHFFILILTCLGWHAKMLRRQNIMLQDEIKLLMKRIDNDNNIYTVRCDTVSEYIIIYNIL